MGELKDLQQQVMEGRLQFHSHLTLMEHVCIFESLRLEGLSVGNSLYLPFSTCAAHQGIVKLSLFH